MTTTAEGGKNLACLAISFAGSGAHHANAGVATSDRFLNMRGLDDRHEARRQGSGA
jgi:hypothetical protein